MADSNQVTLDKKIPWIFFLNTFSQQFGITVTLQFMNLFMTDFVKVAPMVLASILAVGRIIDSAISFVAGGIVQKANLKTGPYRTWILINGPLLTIGIFLIFWNPSWANDSQKVVIFVIGYLFRNIPQNFLIAAQNTLISKVGGTNMNNRLAITAKNTQGTSSASVIVSAMTVPLITYLNEVVGNGRGYLIVGVIYGLFQTVGQVVIYFAVAEYDQYDPNLKKVEGSSVNVKVTHMYGDTLKNPQVWFLIIMATTRTVATNTLSSLTAYFFRYSIGQMNYMALSNTIAAFFGLFVSFTVPPFARKLGKKNSQVVSGIGMFIGYLGMAMFANGRVYVYIALVCFNRMFTGLSTTIGVNNWLDAAEYQLYKTGRDSRPFIMSINSITMKIGQTLSSFTYAFVLQYADYQSTAEGVTIDVVKLCHGMFGMIAALYAVSTIAISFYSITEAKAKEYAEANKKMIEERTAAAAAAAPAAAAPK